MSLFPQDQEQYALANNGNLSSTEKLGKLDSLLIKYKSQRWDSTHLNALYQKGLLHFQLHQHDSFFYYNHLLLKKGLGNEDVSFTGKATFNLAYYFDELVKSPDSAYYYYNASKNALLKLGDSIGVGRKLLNIATIQKLHNDFFGAKETLTEAISFLPHDKDPKFLASAYNELATNHKKLLNYKDAIHFYYKAIETSNSPEDIIIYKNNLSLVYKEKGEYTNAIVILDEIFKDSILKSNPTEYARILDNLTYNQWKNGKTNVESDFLQALKIRKEQHDLRGMVSSYDGLSEFYTDKNFKKAKAHLDSLIMISKKIEMPEGELEALKRLMILEPKKHKHKDRYIFLKDSLYKQELKVKTQFAKMKYDDQQEKAHLLALETETAQKEVQLAKQETQSILFLSLSGLLLLGGTSLYLLLRQRHKKEKLQEVYNTEKRISQDLHDGLANDVFGLMANIQGKKHKDEELISKLDDIYQVTRQISHENAAIKIGKEFKDELTSLISTYQNSGTNLLTKGINNIDWERFESPKCVAIHRSIKELLVNMKKHSQASLVSLQFQNQNNKLIIVYSDNGVGFKPEALPGIGLVNTENRINAVGGKFIFEPKQGYGTKVKISIPF